MKLIKLILIATVFVVISPGIYAQECGFDGIREKHQIDLSFVELERIAEKRIQDAIKNRDLSKMAGGVLTIPIVVHVLHLGENVGVGTNISEAQIQSSIDNLNDYYRGQIPTSPVDFEIQFTLALRDPNCNATTGVNRIDASTLPGYAANGVNVNNTNGASYSDIVALSNWPQNDYFNVWIVSELDGNNGGFGFQGYAYFYQDNASFHGSVMMSTVFGYDPGNTNGWGLNSNGDNSTVVHEVGHYFNLYHTFQGDEGGGSCPLDITVGTDSDGCADTVPHRRETSTCPPIDSCTGNPWVDNNTINNIMGYYFCSDKLTDDQKIRVRAAMEDTAIVNSVGAVPIDPNFVAPSTVCSTNTSAANNFAGIFSVELNGKTNESSTTGIDGGNIDGITSCANVYEIDATAPNTLNVELSLNVQQLGVWIDWNNDGDFNDDSEQQYLQQEIAGGSTVAINLNYPTVIPFDSYVRIRLVEDLDDQFGVPLINSPCPQNLVYGQVEDYAIYLQSGGPVTYTYNNTWSPSSPVGVSSSADTIIIESGTVNIDANTDCNTLTVNPGAALTIDAGVNITATTVDLNSTSQLFSSLISDGTINGIVNYNRYAAEVGPTGTNDLISAPVAGQLFPTFSTLNPNLPASGLLRAFAPYSTTAGTYQNYNIVANALTTIDAGVGYRTATTDGGSLTFTGAVRTDNVLDIPISDASAGFAWNLIGNPYPSYIDFETFFNTNSDEFAAGTAFQAVYGYDGNASNGWTVWNMTTILDTNITELIAPGQAFFVKSKTGGGLVDFTTAMRRTGSSDDFILGRQPIVNLALCQLNLNSTTNNSSSTKIYFIEGTTRGLDVGYDAGSYTAITVEFSIFSNLVEDNIGLDIAIQALPYEDFNDVVIPLGIKAVSGETLTISIDDISSLPSDVNVYLEDNVSNTWTLLNNGDYSFSPSVDLNGTGRFYIHYSSTALSIEENQIHNLQIFSTSKPKEIVIKGQLTNETTANLYDIRGRLILNQELKSTNIYNTIDVSDLGTGIYLIKVFDNNQTKTQKLVIN